MPARMPTKAVRPSRCVSASTITLRCVSCKWAGSCTPHIYQRPVANPLRDLCRLKTIDVQTARVGYGKADWHLQSLGPVLS
jgi:hypothetical protein